MRTKWKIWNVDRGNDVAAKPHRSLRKAIADAMALEARSGEHHAVVPA